MNRYPEFNQGERTRANRVQRLRRAKARNSHRLLWAAERKRTSHDLNLPLRPARGLLICLGWLRLFQHIVAPRYALIPRREFQRGRRY
jgi:hypothetical protein